MKTVPTLDGATRKRIPSSVSNQYEGGARGFKAEKRRQLKAAFDALRNLRVGCAYFPCGVKAMDEVYDKLEIVAAAISEKNWGR